MKVLPLGTREGTARTLTVLSILAATTVALMVVGILFTHSSQEYLQTARGVAEVQQHLGDPALAWGLRLNLGLDDAFMLWYTAFFVVLAFVLSAFLFGRRGREVVAPRN